jgi:hypothetical protein
MSASEEIGVHESDAIRIRCRNYSQMANSFVYSEDEICDIGENGVRREIYGSFLGHLYYEKLLNFDFYGLIRPIQNSCRSFFHVHYTKFSSHCSVFQWLYDFCLEGV